MAKILRGILFVLWSLVTLPIGILGTLAVVIYTCWTFRGDREARNEIMGTFFESCYIETNKNFDWIKTGSR